MLSLPISHDLLAKLEVDLPAKHALLAHRYGQLLGTEDPGILPTPRSHFSRSGSVHLPVCCPHDEFG